MLIDWFTVGAQAVNFLALVFLLQHFLYKPILKAIATREKKISDELADADAKKVEAQKDRDEFAQKNATFDQQKASLWTAAQEQANAENKRLRDAAVQVAEALAATRTLNLKNEEKNLQESVARRIQQEVFEVSRKALTDLAGASLDDQMVKAFTAKLDTLDEKDRTALTATRQISDPVTIRTATDLSPANRAAVEAVVQKTFGGTPAIQFQTAPEILGGVELSAGGQKVAWSLGTYLSMMENSIEPTEISHVG